jgi:hypothetical protein
MTHINPKLIGVPVAATTPRRSRLDWVAVAAWLLPPALTIAALAVLIWEWLRYFLH